MKNPFEKLVSSRERLMEKKKIVDVRYKIMNDRVYLWDVYEDRSESGDMTELGVDPSDPIACREAIRNYKRRKGIENWADFNMD